MACTRKNLIPTEENLGYPYLGVKVYIEALFELVQAYDVGVKDAHILEVSAKLKCK